jgi:hypothetical protein
MSRPFFVGACLFAAVLPAIETVTTAGAAAGAEAITAVAAQPVWVEWPTHFRDRPLTQLALTPLEARFAHRFPGAIARFTDGTQLLILREVTQPTRRLHPAADCFRAAGYAIDVPRAFSDAHGERWSCFRAARDGQRVRVCERLQDADGNAWTDVSAWYWSALWSGRAGGRGGPWRAITVVTPVRDGRPA